MHSARRHGVHPRVVQRGDARCSQRFARWLPCLPRWGDKLPTRWDGGLSPLPLACGAQLDAGLCVAATLQVLLEWDPPMSPLGGDAPPPPGWALPDLYQVAWKAASAEQDEWREREPVTGDVAQRGHGMCTVAWLRPSTWYHFRVRAHTAAGWGPYSNASAAVMTDAPPPPPPPMPTMRRKGERVVVVEWAERAPPAASAPKQESKDAEAKRDDAKRDDAKEAEVPRNANDELRQTTDAGAADAAKALQAPKRLIRVPSEVLVPPHDDVFHLQYRYNPDRPWLNVKSLR